MSLTAHKQSKAPPSLWRNLRDRARRGVAAVEFALSLPIWITLLLGIGDGTYYLLVAEKTDRISYTITDIVSQYTVITLANLNDVFTAAKQLMLPYSFDSNGIVIVSSIYKPPSTTSGTSQPIVQWQYSGGGSLSKTSAIGHTGGIATLPNGLVLNQNDNVIITEVYYNFTPLFVSSGMFGASTLYRVSIYKPRLSPLITPPT